MDHHYLQEVQAWFSDVEKYFYLGEALLFSLLPMAKRGEINFLFVSEHESINVRFTVK